MSRQSEQAARELLPCEHIEDKPGYYGDPSECFSCAKRPAVAAALDAVRAEVADAIREHESDHWRDLCSRCKIKADAHLEQAIRAALERKEGT